MIQGLLLAAGRGRRFRGDKLLYPLEDGRPLVLHSAQALLAVTDVLAVVRPDQPVLEDLLRAAGCRICYCEDADAGMGHSLAAGVRASADADGWLVALGDMPSVGPESHAAVKAALAAGAPLAAPYFLGRRGHPVGFAREFGPALLQLSGDIGARELLRSAEDRLVRVAVQDPGVRIDIDTPADLTKRAQA